MLSKSQLENTCKNKGNTSQDIDIKYIVCRLITKKSFYFLPLILQDPKYFDLKINYVDLFLENVCDFCFKK